MDLALGPIGGGGVMHQSQHQENSSLVLSAAQVVTASVYALEIAIYNQLISR